MCAYTMKLDWRRFGQSTSSDAHSGFHSRDSDEMAQTSNYLPSAKNAVANLVVEKGSSGVNTPYQIFPHTRNGKPITSIDSLLAV